MINLKTLVLDNLLFESCSATLNHILNNRMLKYVTYYRSKNIFKTTKPLFTYQFI